MAQNAPLRSLSPGEALFGEVRKNWGWLLALGILSVVLGTIGIAMTVTLTLAGVLFFGALLLVGGMFQLLDAFKCRGWKGTLVHVIIGLIYIGVGLIVVFDPIGAAVALTLVLGIAFVAIGVLRLVMAFQHRGASGWGWALGGGLVAIALGVLVTIGWPATSFWAIGLFIAIELIVNGWTYIFVAAAARRAGREEVRGTGPSVETPA